MVASAARNASLMARSSFMGTNQEETMAVSHWPIVFLNYEFQMFLSLSIHEG